VSAINGEGLEAVVKAILAMLKEMPAPAPIEHEEFKYEKVDVRKFNVIYDEEDNVYVVDGPIIKLLSRNVVLNDMDSLAYMQKTLKDYGVITALRNKGCKDGDTVILGDIEFDFVD
jgi:GTP-binding protein